jgi:hypothetical protein
VQKSLRLEEKCGLNPALRVKIITFRKQPPFLLASR